MIIKTFIKAVFIKLKRKGKLPKRLMYSYVSLFLVSVLILMSVVAWYTAATSVSVNTSTLSMNGASGMRNDRSKKVINEVVIPASNLEEASSVDGRNIFFPSSIFNNVSDNNNSSVNNVTKGIVYREANAGDQTHRYAYAQTELSGSSDNTNVWIRSYEVKIGDEVYRDIINVNDNGSTPAPSGVLDNQDVTQDCPVRIAIISDSGDDPKVFDPSAMVKEYSIDTDSVYFISQEGVPKTQTSNLDAFSSYYYGTGNPLFVLNKDETKEIAVVAWLEGTHPRAKDFENKTLSVEIEIETNVSDMEYVFFHDWTVGDEHSGVNAGNYKDASNNWLSETDHTTHTGHWLSNNNVVVAMTYFDTLSSTYKTASMTKMVKNKSYRNQGTDYVANDDYTYMAAIPAYVTTDISFYRLASMTDHENDTDIKKGQIYNSWHTKSGMNSQLSNTASGWANSLFGSLQTTRVINGTQRTHYHAIRGNGYGEISRRLTTYPWQNREWYWLSPCVGYWGTATDPVRGS